MPVRSDYFDGEWILDNPEECPAGASSSGLLASPHAPAPPHAHPTAAAGAAAVSVTPTRSAVSAPLQVHAKAFSPPANSSLRTEKSITTLTKKQALPLWKAWVRQPANGHHAIVIPAGTSKNGMSRARFERIRGCRTIGEFLSQWRQLEDKSKCWYDDLSDEIWRELVRLHALPVSDYPANVRPEHAARKSATAAARALSTPRQPVKGGAMLSPVGKKVVDDSACARPG